jgi:hypothetical protein
MIFIFYKFFIFSIPVYVYVVQPSCCIMYHRLALEGVERSAATWELVAASP